MLIHITGGRVVDGTGAPAFAADVVVEDGRIVAITGSGRPVDGALVLDATGKVVAPGFVDAHTHSDYTIIGEPAGAGKLLQGVTTEVTGNCGFSPFPIVDEHRSLSLEHFAGVGVAVDDLGGCDPDWHHYDGYVEQVRAARPGINVAPLVGHGTLRIAVMGSQRRVATDDEIAAMCALLDAELAAGAIGLSTGLGHGPPATSDFRELVALGSTVAAHGGVFAFHSRGNPRHRGAKYLAGLLETAAVGRESGVQVQYSHAALNNPDHWGSAGEWTAALDAQRASGVDITFDVYPYDASGGSLVQFLPPDLHNAGHAALVATMADPSARAAAIEAVRPGWAGGGVRWIWDRVVVGGAPDPSLGGKSIAELAEASGLPPEEQYLEVCAEHWNLANAIMHYRTEEDMLTFLRHPAAMVGSDGSVMDPIDRPGSLPHPRSFGYAPRILGRYVRDQQAISLEDAVRKLSGAVAERFGLAGRGTIAVGQVADLAVFDPDTIIDTATYEAPFSTPIGMTHVLVAGEVAVRDGEPTGVRAGDVLTIG